MNIKRTILILAFALLCISRLPVRANGQTQEISPSVFLKAFYPLDEPRFHCVDIPGHQDRVDLTRPLTVHTCKEGIWHKDQLFDPATLKAGQLKMSEYGLCVEAIDVKDGAKLVLKPCNGSGLQLWVYKDFRLTLKSHPDRCLTIGSEPSELTPGGIRLASRHMARSLELRSCSEAGLQRQLWRFETPQQRTSPVTPFSE